VRTYNEFEGYHLN